MRKIEVKKLLKDKRIRYIKKFVNGMKDDAFIDKVNKISVTSGLEGLSTIQIKQFGIENKDKIIYLIRLDKKWVPTAGFFALHFKILNSLLLADRLGFTPVLDILHKCTYFEENPINGTKNAYEYYFKPLSNVGLESARKSYNIVIPSEANMMSGLWKRHEDWFKPSEEFIEVLANVQKKYVQLNEYEKPKIDKDIKNILKDKRTLAVHVRGTDYSLNCNYHPVSLTVMDYVPIINDALDNLGFEQIFLATDDLAIIDFFNEKYGDKVVYYKDVFRGKGNTSVAFTENNRENHHYLLGLEVVRDMFTLASCDGLIAGLSQVSICARITKKSMENEYDYLKIIDKGINYNSKDWVKISEERNRSK